MWQDHLRNGFHAHEDKGIRLERKSENSKQLHLRLSKEYNSRSENSTENLGDHSKGLYDRASRPESQ